MNKTEIVISCPGVVFYSPLDEDVFFHALYKLSCIKKISGKGKSILVFFKKKSIKFDDLYALIGLFRRYNIPTNLLEIFLTEKNQDDFDFCLTSCSVNVYPNR